MVEGSGSKKTLRVRNSEFFFVVHTARLRTAATFFTYPSTRARNYERQKPERQEAGRSNSATCADLDKVCMAWGVAISDLPLTTALTLAFSNSAIHLGGAISLTPYKNQVMTMGDGQN